MLFSLFFLYPSKCMICNYISWSCFSCLHNIHRVPACVEGSATHSSCAKTNRGLVLNLFIIEHSEVELWNNGVRQCWVLSATYITWLFMVFICAFCRDASSRFWTHIKHSIRQWHCMCMFWLQEMNQYCDEWCSQWCAISIMNAVRLQAPKAVDITLSQAKGKDNAKPNPKKWALPWKK